MSWTKNWSKCWGWLVSLFVLAHRNGLRELAAGRCSCCCPHTPAQICRFPSGDSRLGTKNWSRNTPMVCVPHVPRTAARVALSAGEARCADELRAPSNGDDDILCRYVVSRRGPQRSGRRTGGCQVRVGRTGTDELGRTSHWDGRAGTRTNRVSVGVIRLVFRPKACVSDSLNGRQADGRDIALLCFCSGSKAYGAVLHAFLVSPWRPRGGSSPSRQHPNTGGNWCASRRHTISP